MIIQDIIRESVDKLMSLTMSVKQIKTQDSENWKFLTKVELDP